MKAKFCAFSESLPEDISDLGRKWRAAMMQLGFITPDSKRLIENGYLMFSILCN